MDDGTITIHKCEVCGKFIAKDESQYFYKKKYYHHDHLLKKLKSSRKPKFSPEEISEIIKKSRKPSALTQAKNKREKKIKVVQIPTIVDKEQFKIDTKNRETLIDYIRERYNMDTRSNGALTRILNSINKGTYKGLDGECVPDDMLLTIIKYYSNELDYIRVKSKKTFETTQSMFFWDLAVAISKIPDYEKATKKVESEMETTESIVNTDVIGYLGKRIETSNSTDDDDIDLSGFSEGYF